MIRKSTSERHHGRLRASREWPGSVNIEYCVHGSQVWIPHFAENHQDISTMKTQKILLLLLLVFAGLNGCHHSEQLEMDEEFPAPEIGFNLTEPSPLIFDDACQCSNEFKFTTNYSSPHTASRMPGFDFGVQVNKTSDCDPNLCWGNKCGSSHGKFVLKISNLFELGLTMGAFSEIRIQSAGQILSPDSIDWERGNIIAPVESGEVLFKWDENIAGTNPSFSQLQFESGGICIIDILTDPEGNGGSR